MFAQHRNHCGGQKSGPERKNAADPKGFALKLIREHHQYRDHTESEEQRNGLVDQHENCAHSSEDRADDEHRPIGLGLRHGNPERDHRGPAEDRGSGLQQAEREPEGDDHNK